MTATYEPGWYLAERDGKTLRLHTANDLTDVRPAIVLDPNDTDVRQFCAQYHVTDSPRYPVTIVARQIAAQMTKAKPPEPAEFGSVVRDSDGRFWLLSRVDGGRDCAWVTDDSTAGHVWRAFYADINVVEVIRVGLS